MGIFSPQSPLVLAESAVEQPILAHLPKPNDAGQLPEPLHHPLTSRRNRHGQLIALCNLIQVQEDVTSSDWVNRLGEVDGRCDRSQR
jgi:hypothetical protein